MKNAAILLFDDVEVLDFAGPFEVFSVTNELNGYGILNVYTVARQNGPLKARNGLSVNPDYAMTEAPEPDILIIPGVDSGVMDSGVRLDFLPFPASHEGRRR